MNLSFAMCAEVPLPLSGPVHSDGVHLVLLAAKPNLLGQVLQFVLAAALTLAPAAFLKKDKMYVSIVLSFLAIFLASKALGLLLAVPVTVVLVLYLWWLRYLAAGGAAWKRIAFKVTIVLVALYLSFQLLHLPNLLGQQKDPYRAAGHLIGLFFAAAMFSAQSELLATLRRRRAIVMNQHLSATPATEPRQHEDVQFP